MNAVITATARYLPKRVLSNFDLEKMVETSDEWIKSRTGISERRLVSEGESTSDMGIHVAHTLLKRAHKSPDEIDLIIMATVTSDLFFPACAPQIQAKIGAVNAWAYDLSAACSGFLYALETGAKMVESGAYKNVMVIAGDTMSSVIDYTDRNTCVIFGDGAGGVLLEPSKGKNGIMDAMLFSDGGGESFLKIPAGGSLNPPSLDTVEKRLHYVQQDGKTVFKFAVKRMADVSKSILDRNNLTGNDIKLFIPHQANKRIIDAAAKRCEIDEDKVLINIHKYGNTTDGTIPIALDEAVEGKMLSEGDLLLLAAFGGGFTWGSILIRWGAK